MKETLDEQKQRIVREVIEAIDCAKRGEPHPRLISYMGRSLEARLRRQQNRRPLPAPVVTPSPTSVLVLDFERPSYGPGGARRND